MNKTSQELHYTRAIRFIDKLYALVEDGKYNKEEEKNFFVNLANNPFVRCFLLFVRMCI